MKGGRWKIAAAALCLVIGMAGCGSAWQYRPITDVQNLEGRRVGVNLAWEADYLLTGRKDLELSRYDETSAMLMAMSSNKLDAMAMDELLWKVTQAVADGLERVEPAFATANYLAYFGHGREGLLEEFNAFLAEYRQSEDYADLVRRREAFDGVTFSSRDIPQGTGETLRVAVTSAGFPRSYLDPGETVPEGIDVEVVKQFGLARNYRLEFTVTTYEDILLGINNGLYDIGVGYLCDTYREEASRTGMLLSDPLDNTRMYFVQKNRENIELLSPLD